MSQEVLSGLLAVDHTTVSRWENEKSCPEMQMIEAMAEMFNVTPYYLMFGRDYLRDPNLLDLNGLSLFQIKLVKDLVEELRKGC